MARDDRYMYRGGSVDWTVVAGARIDKEVQDKIRELQEKYPRQFTVQEVSREQLRQALTVAKHLEKRKAREAKEQARLERARDERVRREVRATENETRKKDIARVVSENVRAIEQARAEGKVFAARELSEAHRSAIRSMRKVRRYEKVQGRETVASLGLTGERARVMEDMLTQGRERQRAKVVRGIEAIGRESRDRQAAERTAMREAERLARQREVDARRRELVRQGVIRADLANVLDVIDKAQARVGDQVPPGLENIRQLRGGRERT
ncbi:hypothetical protein [Nocardia jiangxiensis]|uniref:hypothetical protein n=1 Tax=Nocardia jiangxiensis TaxID=282685 RepID=UPI0012F6AA45|nr:hypothetical protein [Nocardia jiangxiensis]